MKKLVTIALLGLMAASLAGNGVLASPLSIDTLILKYFVFQDKATGRYYVKPVKGSTDVDTSTPVNPPPVADAGQDTVLPQDINIVVLDGSGSYAQGGATISSYAWTQTGGGTTTINSPSTDTTTIFGLTASGNYVYSLTVTDNNGLTATSSITVTVPELPSYRYLIQKGANFYFSPTIKTISGYTGVVGDPSDSIVTATDDSTGWTVSTVGPDTTLWNPDPLLGSKSASENGMKYTTPVDPWGYGAFDSAAMAGGYINYRSQYVPGTYNLKISGLDPTKEYQIWFTGSFTKSDSTSTDVYDSRTLYRLSSGVGHSLNTDYTTSKYVVADLQQPDASGNLYASVTGQDTAYSGYSNGIISAMRIYELSKDTGTGTTDLYKYYYDTIWVNDGSRERLCVVYKPYNFNPDSSYPILMYLDGQESAVKDFDNFDPEISTMDGIGTSLQHYKGAIYGLKANGDTGSFVILIPQFTVNEWALDTGEISHILTNFKARESGTYKFNDSLFLGGFSSGGMMAVWYTIYNPSKVTGAYIASPADNSSMGIHLPTSQDIADSIAKFPTYGTKMWLVERNDISENNVDTLLKYLKLYAPDNYYYTYWDREHSGFAWEWTMDTTNSLHYRQTPYDWAYNSTRNDYKMTYFVFNGPSGLWPFYTSGLAVPDFTVRTATDSNTGWTISSVSGTNWAGSATPTGMPTYNALAQYPQYVQRTIMPKGWENTLTAGYGSLGKNIEISGLLANHSYTIYWDGGGNPASSPGDISIMTWGSQSVTNNGSLPTWYTRQPNTMTGMSDASGNIDLGFYPSASGSGKAFLAYLFIREN